jgi:hypothetical protein
MGTLILAHKEDLLKEVKNQLTIGPEGLDEQDRFLLECNFDELATTTGGDQVLAASHSGSQRGVMHPQS